MRLTKLTGNFVTSMSDYIFEGCRLEVLCVDILLVILERFPTVRSLLGQRPALSEAVKYETYEEGLLVLAGLAPS